MKKNKIFVIAAHPDDEVLGCGGTILDYVKKGDQVNILILGDGETARQKSKVDIQKRRKQAERAGKLLGVKQLFLESLPDNQFDSLPLLEIVKLVEKYLEKIKPNIIYTHNPNDLNIDHQLTAKAVLTAARPQPNYFVKKILAFEVLSSTEWQMKDKKHLFYPTVYNDITDFIDRKVEILKIYKHELKKYPHPRSEQGVKALAQYRGIESGYHFAEAFQLIRMLND